jgi:hypothetical protein
VGVTLQEMAVMRAIAASDGERVLTAVELLSPLLYAAIVGILEKGECEAGVLQAAKAERMDCERGR